MKICEVENCGRPRLARGLCGLHYQRVHRHGEVTGKYRRPAEERFWKNVEREGPDDCWLWSGNSNGVYGLLYRHPHDGGRTGAHRFSYEMHHGPIPEGMLVLHKCDTPLCVNPAHLRVGTPKENMADMDAKGRRVVAYAKGERSPLSVLNEHAVRFIRSTELSTAELARIFGLTHQAIRAVRIRKSWKHVT